MPEETVRELLELVRFAPSALNLQPWRIRVVTDPAVRERLQPAAFDQPQVTTCSHLLVFCADPDYDGPIRKLDGLLASNGVPARRARWSSACPASSWPPCRPSRGSPGPRPRPTSPSATP